VVGIRTRTTRTRISNTHELPTTITSFLQLCCIWLLVSGDNIYFVFDSTRFERERSF